MKDQLGETNWITLSYVGSSLRDVIGNGTSKATHLKATEWTKLLNNSQIQVKAGHIMKQRYQIENVFPVLWFLKVMVTRVKFGRTRNTVKTRAASECFHNNFEFFQTLTSVTITLCKHRENVFYCFYEIKARSNFLCFHRVMVNDFEPIRARVVS